MKDHELKALPVHELAADNAILFYWETGPRIVLGKHIPIMKAWGFKPTAMGFVYVKLNPNAPMLLISLRDLFTGGGFTTRKNAEFCIIGKRGRSVRENRGVHEVIIEPRREHSRKPDEFYRRCEKYTSGPYLDLFSRTQRRGWHNWGNEVDKFLEDER